MPTTTTTTDTVYLLENDKADEKAAKAAAREAAKAAKAVAKALADAAKAAKADDKAAAVTAAREALTDAVTDTAGETATNSTLAAAMVALAHAVHDLNVGPKVIAEGTEKEPVEFIGLDGKAVKSDTVAKYALAGLALRRGGEQPDVPSVAHAARRVVEQAIGRKVGRKQVEAAANGADSTVSALAAIDALVGKDDDKKERTILALLKAAHPVTAKAADLTDESGIDMAEAHDIIDYCTELVAMLTAIRTAAVDTLGGESDED